MDETAEMEERNRGILVRTAGIVSWLYAAERILVGLALLPSSGGSGLYAPRTFGTLCLVHAALLIIAGEALFRDRRWAWLPSVAAAAGTLFFAVLHARRGNWTGTGVDAAYALVATAALLKRRHLAPPR